MIVELGRHNPQTLFLSQRLALFDLHSRRQEADGLLREFPKGGLASKNPDTSSLNSSVCVLLMLDFIIMPATML